ncbi:MAG: hypothetical protein QM710_10875 [Flavobacterium sp.]
MLRRIFFSTILFVVNIAAAQLCKHTDLSEKLEFDVRFTRIAKEEIGEQLHH